MNRIWLFYVCAPLFVISWWTLTLCPQRSLTLKQLEISQIKPLKTLTPISRDDLKDALNGNFTLMAQLISDWDLDATLLESEGFITVKRLSKNHFLKSQLIGRQLLIEQQQIRLIRHDYTQIDEPKFLPQTYLAASYLLTLAKPEQIVGLPKGFRNIKGIFQEEFTEKIPVDLDRFNAEKLYLSKPKIALIADYSHPAWKELLQQQEVETITLMSPRSVQEICQTVCLIGHAINQPAKAELLSIFIEAALLAIDNHLSVLQKEWRQLKILPKIIFAHYHGQFAPSVHPTITEHLIQRMGILDEAANCEQILSYQPTCLILATHQSEQSKIFNEPFVEKLVENNHTKICFVEDEVQQFASQYIVLAYYDMYHALLAGTL